MPRKKRGPPVCTLGIRPGGPGTRCPDPAECATCGWHPDVIRQRTRAIVLNGLTVGPDGLARLIIRK